MQKDKHNQRYQLTWMAAERRWRKKYRGKRYYFPAKDGETKEASYRRCLDEWLVKKAAIDGNTYAGSPSLVAWRDLLEQAETARAQAKESGNELAWQTANELYLLTQASIAAKRNFPGLSDDSGSAAPLPGNLLGPRAWDQEPTSLDQTIGGNAEEFVRQKTRERSTMRADSIKRAVDHFVTWIGKAATVASITEVTLDRYRDHLAETKKRPEVEAQPKKKIHNAGRPWSDYTCRDYLAAVKQFIRWLWSRRKLENLPRNIEEIGWGVQPKAIQTMEVAEVKTILNAAPEPLRLHLLLMLNCGMLQQDISDLRPDEVDWHSGRICRKRSKTREHAGVPTVEYALWPETIRLLTKYRSADPEHVLKNLRGGLLREDRIVDGKLKRADSIRTAERVKGFETTAVRN